LLRLIDPITDHRWDDFIVKHAEGTIFHSSAWARVLRERYGDVYKYYILESVMGEILGAVPFFHLRNALIGNRLICLPSADSCFPLVNNKNDYNELLAGAVNEVNQNMASTVEIRGWRGLGLPEECAIHRGPLYEFVHVVDLKRDLETLRTSMKRNGRYNLRVAERQSFTLKLGQDEKDLRTLHKMLLDALKKHHALPPAYSFFQSIFRHLIIPGNGLMFFAELRGKIIAGNLYLCFKDTALCKYSAQINSYFEYRPNYFLHWKAIEHFNKKSFRSYDFGGTNPNDQTLLFFKRNWGGEENTQSFYYYPAEIDSRPVLLIKPLHLVYSTLEKSMPNLARGSLSCVMNKLTLD